MRSRFWSYRPVLLVSAALVVSVSLMLALGVIQPVKAELQRGATTEKAVLAFGYNIGINLLSALLLVVIAMRSKAPVGISKTVLVLAGLVVFFLGIALADAASAYRSHGPAMQTASVLLLICAAADLLAGGLAVAVAVLNPGKTRSA